MSSEREISERSQNVIATLLPEVQPLARNLIEKAAEAGIKIEIISGLRSYAEQDKLFAKGRTAPGPKVTNAQGGHSNHNFGIAFDIGVFEGSHYIEESPAYAKVGAMGKELGFFWGGDWESIQDEPHFELRPDWAADLKESDMLAQLRDRHDSGQGVFA